MFELFSCERLYTINCNLTTIFIKPTILLKKYISILGYQLLFQKFCPAQKQLKTLNILWYLGKTALVIYLIF